MKNSLSSISLIASIITVINFALSIALSFEGLSFDIFPSIAGSFETKPLFLRIIMFLLLEVLISFVFVRIYLFIGRQSKESNPLVLVCKAILLMCSAWTSLFNIKWIILDHFNNQGAWVIFLILAALVANYIWAYWYHNETKEDPSNHLKPTAIFFIHATFLALVFSILILDQSF